MNDWEEPENILKKEKQGKLVLLDIKERYKTI